MTVNSGGSVKITGAGGDQIYDGATVTLASGATFDLNGNTETIANLSGNGGVVDNTAAGTTATLTLANGNGTFGGTLQNSGPDASLRLIKSGTGALILGGNHSYSGGTTVSGGTLEITATGNVAMPYTVASGGTLEVIAVNSTTSLPMSSLTLGTGTPTLAFNLNGLGNLAVPLVAASGNLTLNGNVIVSVVNVTQSGTYILLHYAGSRSGSAALLPVPFPPGQPLRMIPPTKK